MRDSGTCVVAIVSLLDVGDIPSKPAISGGGTMGVIATWRAVSAYVQALSVVCQIRRLELGWTAYGEQGGCFSFSNMRVEALNVADGGLILRLQMIARWVFSSGRQVRPLIGVCRGLTNMSLKAVSLFDVFRLFFR